MPIFNSLPPVHAVVIEDQVFNRLVGCVLGKTCKAYHELWEGKAPQPVNKHMNLATPVPIQIAYLA